MRFDNRVTRDLGVDIPIVQAPMGWIARAPLASAVSRAGACGIIETSSCLVSAPVSPALFKNACNLKIASESLCFNDALCDTSICQLMRFGYHATAFGGFIPRSRDSAGNTSPSSLRIVAPTNLPLAFTRNVSGNGSRKRAIIARKSSSDRHTPCSR